VITLGDSSYDTFCFAGLKMRQVLDKCQAKFLGVSLNIDVQQADLPEDTAVAWLPEFMALLAKKS
jgi:MioC protein